MAGSDPRVCGVVSLYGQADLAAHYDHTDEARTCRADDPQPDWDAPPPAWMARLFGPEVGRLHLVPGGRLDWLVGGTPSELPERYAQLSPIEHGRAGCPPTLLVHGLQDEMAPVAAIRQLHQRLEQAGVPVTVSHGRPGRVDRLAGQHQPITHRLTQPRPVRRRPTHPSAIPPRPAAAAPASAPLKSAVEPWQL